MFEKMEVKVTVKYIPTTPKKLRRTINQVKGKTYENALKILKFLPYSASKPSIDILNNAACLAKKKYNFTNSNIYIKSIFVNKGSNIKKLTVKARGKIAQLLKTSSHLTIVVSSVPFQKKYTLLKKNCGAKS